MILMTVLIVMFMGVALLMAVYASFLPFVQNYGNMVQYTTAYYGAISAIERGVLAATLRGPGFDGESGWRRNGSRQATQIGNSTDQKIPSFYNYGDDNKTSLYWKVKSSTNKIPAEGDGNVPADFWDSSSTSKDYNTLNYNIAEAIALGTPGAVQSANYYSQDTNTDYITPNTEISLNIRLNPLLKERLKDPNKNRYLSASIDKLPLVNWTLKGNKQSSPFSIIPTEAL